MGYLRSPLGLGDEIADVLERGLPSVVWRDEGQAKQYENDVVAIIGNTIFLFEAKSGRLDDAGKRGAELSLLKDFRELFIEPGKQASRLENYLNTKKIDAKLWLKQTQQPVRLDLDKPKVVHKFSICIEHYAALTSAKHNLKKLGLVSDDDAWAPILGLGELQLVCRHLDTEVSFFHYFTRRATLEQVITFHGDEMDILAVYLANGLCIDGKQFEGKTIFFRDVDQIVRGPETPRLDRQECEIYGIPLSGYWLAIVRELYADKSLRHRFDLIEVILNQDPHSLAAAEAQLRRWKRGLGKGGDLVFLKREIGRRTFLLGLHMTKHRFDDSEWRERSRNIAYEAGHMFAASDCAVFGKFKKSKEWTYDGVSFFRMGRGPGGSA